MPLFHSKTSSLLQIEQIEVGTPGRLRVVAQSTISEEIIEGEYNTVRNGPRLILYQKANNVLIGYLIGT